MNDKAFLQYALEQSFLHPYNNAAENVVLSHDTSWADAYRFADKKHPDIVPCLVPFADMRKYSKSVGYDVKRTPQLYEEILRRGLLASEKTKDDGREVLRVPVSPEDKQEWRTLTATAVDQLSDEINNVTAHFERVREKGEPYVDAL